MKIIQKLELISKMSLKLFTTPKIFKELIIKLTSSELINKAEALISIDARGFVFGSAIALQTSKPMIVARKPGKLPGEIIKKKYNLGNVETY